MSQLRKKDERMITRGRNRMEGGSILLFVFCFKMGKHWNIFISLREEASGNEEKEVKCGDGRG